MKKTMARLAALVLAAGCGKSDGQMPTTYPVTGTVAFQDGEPLRGGFIVFRAASEEGLSISGVVGEDGSFTLQTLKGKEKASGAPEGSYKVSYLPHQGEDQRMLMPPVELPQSFQVEPKENHIEIKVPRPAGH